MAFSRLPGRSRPPDTSVRLVVQQYPDSANDDVSFGRDDGDRSGFNGHPWREQTNWCLVDSMLVQKQQYSGEEQRGGRVMVDLHSHPPGPARCLFLAPQEAVETTSCQPSRSGGCVLLYARNITVPADLREKDDFLE